MADLSLNDSSQKVSIVGSDSTGSETHAVASSVNGELLTVDGLSSGGVYGNLNLAVANTAYEAIVGATKLANRKLLTITALDDMYWGYNSSVTTANGTPLFRNQSISFDINPNSTFSIFLVASGNNKNARITESP